MKEKLNVWYVLENLLHLSNTIQYNTEILHHTSSFLLHLQRQISPYLHLQSFEMKKMDLVFIPGPGIGHLSSTVQIANLLIDRNHHLFITILIINLPSSTNSNTQQHESLSTDRIQFITLPQQPLGDGDASKMRLLYKYVTESNKQIVRDTVAKLPHQLAGFVLDMFCSTMIDVANEFGVPSYTFFTSGAGYLSFTLHLQKLYDFHDNQTFKQFLHSDIEIPGFTNPIPSKAIPIVYLNEDMADWVHEITRRFRETKGILVNTFSELESQVLNSFFQHTTSDSGFPTVYAVGPILDLNKKNSQTSSSSDDILKWLDEQPPSSVLFLCFGSRGSFDKTQVKEIAQALERSGYRFLWSLRKPPPAGEYQSPSEYENVEEVLPEGFLDRTADIGRVIGWAPQTEILAHPATGGFVSHCGWNSTLESIWFGVPIGTWPLYAEQHFNAFEMVVELGLAVEISLDCQRDFFGSNGVIVSADKIENGIRKLMEGDSDVRKMVKVKSEESRKSTMEGGSSFSSLNRFIDEVVDNVS